MAPYANSNGNSGITAYEIQRDAIVIEFRHGGRYIYDYDTTGREHVEEMKVLALEGRGLATYISKNVRDTYAAKL
jgi:hypothetical protein